VLTIISLDVTVYRKQIMADTKTGSSQNCSSNMSCANVFLTAAIMFSTSSCSAVILCHHTWPEVRQWEKPEIIIF